MLTNKQFILLLNRFLKEKHILNMYLFCVNELETSKLNIKNVRDFKKISRNSPFSASFVFSQAYVYFGKVDFYEYEKLFHQFENLLFQLKNNSN